MEVVKQERIKQIGLEKSQFLVNILMMWMQNFTMEQCSYPLYLNKKACLKQDIDGTFPHVNVADLTMLDKNTPKQGIESSQINSNVETFHEMN